jgi:hypothetical protein
MAATYRAICINPLSGRQITVGGEVYRRLVRVGAIIPERGDEAPQVPQGAKVVGNLKMQKYGDGTPDQLRKVARIPEDCTADELEYLRRELDSELPEGYSAVVGRGTFDGYLVARKLNKREKRTTVPIGHGMAEREEARDWLDDQVQAAFAAPVPAPARGGKARGKKRAASPDDSGSDTSAHEDWAVELANIDDADDAERSSAEYSYYSE